MTSWAGVRAHFSPQWVSQPGYSSLQKTGTFRSSFPATANSSALAMEAQPGSDPASSMYGVAPSAV